MVKTHSLLLAIILTAAFSAQAKLPKTLQLAPKGDLQLAEVNANISNLFDGSHVRWGGTILSIKNIKGGTQIELIERPLNESGIPTKGASSGRFIVQHPQVLDRKHYSRGQVLTILGKITGNEKAQIGNRLISIPIVQLTEHHLWGSEYTHFKKKSTLNDRGLTRHHERLRSMPYLHHYPGAIISSVGIYIHPNSGLWYHPHIHHHYGDHYYRPHYPYNIPRR